MIAGIPLVTLLVAGLAALAGIAYIIVVRRSPRVGLIAFLVVIAFVPVWVEVHALVTVSMASAAAGGAALALLSRKLPERWTFPDLVMGFLFLFAVAPLALSRISLNAALVVIFVWGTAYILGRVTLLNVAREDLFAWTAAILAIVAGLAVIEFFTGWHGLSQWGPANSNRTVWGTIQERGGLARAEGAFGHSIALGATLAMGAVLAVEARFSIRTRLILIAIMLGGAAVTLSRLGIACAALGLALCALRPPSERAREMRPWLVGLLGVGAVALLPFILGVLTEAGSEAAGSAAYRGNLLDLLPFVDLLGTTSAAYTAPDGTKYIGGFRSIDSQLLIFGLAYGWLTLGCVLLLLVLAIVAVWNRRGGVAAIAIVAQVPALATVALITQYAVFFWFVSGLAVASSALINHSRVGAPLAAKWPRELTKEKR